MIKEKKCLFCKSKNVEKKEATFAPFLIERMFMSNPKRTSWVHCKHCNLWSSSYRPNDEEMTRLYSGYRDENYQKQRQKTEPFYTEEFNYNLGHNPKTVINRKMFLESIVKKQLNPEKITKVLDYGGDNGQFIPDCFASAQKFVYEVSNVPTIEGVKNISKDEIVSNPDFDFIMCCHVLEHVANPIAIVKDLVTYCKDGGYIYIEVPQENMTTGYDFIHEHISLFSCDTLLQICHIFNNINIIDIGQPCSRYVLIRKEKISLLKKYYKIIFCKIKLFLDKYSIRNNIMCRKLIMFIKLV